MSSSCAPSGLIHGCWQLAREHRSQPWPPTDIVDSLARLVVESEGVVTFDCADIYTGVEELLGQVRQRLEGDARLTALRVHTKFVPDLDRLESLSRADVKAGIERSVERLGVHPLPLVQYHWWNAAVDRYVDVAHWLAELVEEGWIERLGATNFTTAMLRRMLDAGVPIGSHQIQYSLLDGRPAGEMFELCRDRGVDLLCYGTAAGGFLGERWLGAADPGSEPGNRSLTKYRLMIEEMGGWASLQELLRALKERAGTAPLALAAAAWTLQRPGVRAVILGWRDVESALEARRHLAGGELQQLVGDFEAPSGCVPVQGDVYQLERDPGRHSAILKTNLNDDTER